LNANTSMFQTCYTYDIDNEGINNSLYLYADMINEPLFDETKLKLELNNVNSE